MVKKLKNYHTKQKTFKELTTKNQYAEYPDYDLRKEIKKLNLPDNKTLVGKENI